MTRPSNDSAFDRFAARHAGAFERIARAARGELEPGDVRSEAWVMARSVQWPDGSAFDPDQPGADDFLLARLYQKLVKYTEVTVRHAVRIDHAAPGSDDGSEHPLLRRLASDGGRGPLDELEQRQSAIDEEELLRDSGSLAAAWVCLLRRFDNRMARVARHLMISISWANRRCARARVLAVFQQPLKTAVMGADFLPGPWRAFPYRAAHVERQMEFAFDDELAL